MTSNDFWPHFSLLMFWWFRTYKKIKVPSPYKGAKTNIQFLWDTITMTSRKRGNYSELNLAQLPALTTTVNCYSPSMQYHQPSTPICNTTQNSMIRTQNFQMLTLQFQTACKSHIIFFVRTESGNLYVQLPCAPTLSAQLRSQIDVR